MSKKIICKMTRREIDRHTIILLQKDIKKLKQELFTLKKTRRKRGGKK